MVSKLDASSMSSVRSVDRREPLRREAPEPGASSRTELRDPDLRVSLSTAARRLALAIDAEVDAEVGVDPKQTPEASDPGAGEPSAGAALAGSTDAGTRIAAPRAAAAYREAPRAFLGERLDLRV